ncbi:Glycosyl transferase, group 1 [Limnobacter sp. MED105]|nr:Glycosyl transferase, group 1 [Limnobacter sp. MED105]
MRLSKAQCATSGDIVSVVGLNHPDWPKEASKWVGGTPYLFDVIGPRSLGYAPNMLSGIEALNPDIVHLHGLWMHSGRSVLQWAKKTRKPYVVSVHGMLSDVALSYGRQKKRFVLQWFQKEVLERAAAIHVTSSAEADEVFKFGLNNPLIQIPNGVEQLYLSVNQTSTKDKVVLSLGRFHKKKGLSLLLKAWQPLEKEFPDWSLLLVGPDQDGEVNRLKGLSSELGLSKVRFHGQVWDKQKIDIMASASIFALPSLSENFAITVAESLMLGVPVVCSKGAPWQGLDEHKCGKWVDIGPEPMEHGLRELMCLSPEKLQDMGQRGREWMIQDYSWDSIALAMRSEYQSVLEKSVS